MSKKKDEMVDYQKVAEELAAENAQLNEALLRERADAMNVRKRAEDDKLKLAGYYKAHIIKELLPVIDNFERSLKHAPKELAENQYIQGIQSIVKQFETTLGKLGLQRIKTVGEHFDPNLHEAVSMEEGDPSEAGQAIELVSEELQSGYTLGDEVIRHAMVRVISHSEKA